MLASPLIALALSAAAVIAAPTTTTPNTPSYKQCTVLASPWREHFGRTKFSKTNSWMLTNPLKIVDDQGAAVAQTMAYFNRDAVSLAETPGAGLILVPAATTRLEPLKLGIRFHMNGAGWEAFVETLKGEACVVPGSEKWTSVAAILNAEEKGKPLLDCAWAKMEDGERYTDPKTEMSSIKGGKGHYDSSNSVSKDVKNQRPALEVQFIRHFGVFVDQDPAYTKTTKIAIEYIDIKGEVHTELAFANNSPVQMQEGDWSADVYSTGFCKMPGSDTWARVKSVKYVV
jgi:hypothetical protein